GGEGGEVDERAGDQVLVIHVAAHQVGRGRAVLAVGRGRGHAHAAEKRTHGDGDAGGEVGEHGLPVERDDAHGAQAGHVEKAAGGAEGVVGVGDAALDFEDVNGKRVAGLGALDIDGAGEDVTAGAALVARDVGVDLLQGGLDLVIGDAGAGQAGGAVGQQGIHRD